MKKARWTRRNLRYAITPTVRLALRIGARGTGRELGAVAYWRDSDRARDEVDSVVRRIEQDARESGYRILPEEPLPLP
mgnify:CR=1 FL=1